jgi:uncharacterized protein (TIGR03435 family)
MVDLTGLKDAYDFTFTWTPKNPRSDIRGRPHGVRTVEKQLGLKIEERKHPLTVIVVDRAGK